MHGPRTTSPVGRCWRFALAAGMFVALLSLWSNAASAACGDYVIFRPLDGAAPPSHAWLPSPPVGNALPDRGPCHGPLCRGSKPVDPMPTPPTPQQIDQRPLALLAGHGEMESPYLAGGGWPRLDGSPLDGFGQSLLRPPCALGRQWSACCASDSVRPG